MFKISLRINFPLIVASVCKTVVYKRLQNSRKPLQTVVRRVAKVLFDLPMPSTHWDHLSPKLFLIRQVCRIGSVDSPGTLPGVCKRSQTFTYSGKGLASSC